MGRKSLKGLSVVRVPGAAEGGGAEGARRATVAEPPSAAGADGQGLAPGQRWTAARKTGVVLRLLQGEPLDALSREIGVPIFKLEEWKQTALSAMEESLKSRETHRSEAAELAKAKKLIGELTMDLEVLEERVARSRPFVGKRSPR